MITDNKVIKVPMIALRGLTVFPGNVISFDIERIVSLNSLNSAINQDRIVFLVSQKDISVDMPSENDLFRVGTLCYIKQKISHPNGKICRVMVEGLYRAEVKNFFFGTDINLSEICEIPDKRERLSAIETEARIRNCISLYEEYLALNPENSPELLLNLISNPSAEHVSNYIAQNILVATEKKQQLLEARSSIKRLEILSSVLSDEIQIKSLEKELSEATNESISKNQREYFLREELRIIQEELGDDSQSDIEEYRKKIDGLAVSEGIKKKLFKELLHLSKQPYGSSEAAVIRNYLDVCLEIPWGVYTDEIIDLKKARKVLDDEHYGLEKIKSRIVEYLAVKKLSPNVKGGLLCLYGPPGTGKTSIAKSVAHATGRKLVRVSLGGVHDEAEIRGHRKTYIGAMPGRIINGIIQAGSCNPVMVLDEIDKLSSDYHGDPASALLEAFDSEQNSSFRDNYLEVPFDLSDVLFITTANSLDTIPRPLLDRMEIIETSSYTDEEKICIVKKHLISKQRKKHSLNGNQLRITDSAIRKIITGYTRESGVRQLERQIARICRKAAVFIADGEKKYCSVSESNINTFLGPAIFSDSEKRESFGVGLVRGLAYTSAGGEILDVEVAAVDGSGKIEMTGNLGSVMKESASAAITYIRSHANEYGVNADFYKNKDIHIHFPEAAVPKDGPSAGITMCVAIISALSNIPVRQDVAMTGEISLRGRVLPIGGLREKTMAALRNGIFNVIIPKENVQNLEDIDPLVKEKLNFIAVSEVSEVLSYVLKRSGS